MELLVKPNAVKTITADVRPGYLFTTWSGNTQYINPLLATTTIVMPDANVTLTAEYSRVFSPISYIGSNSIYAQLGNPVSVGVTIPTNAKLLVVCIKSPQGGFRTYGIPTINGINLTQVGNYAGVGYSEIWYIVNPPIGLYTLLVPNLSSVNLTVVSSWYSSASPISLYGYSFYSGASLTHGGSISVPSDTEVLLIDSSAIRSYGTYKTLWGSSSGNIIFAGTLNASFGTLTQYSTYNTGINATGSLTYQYGNALQPWYDLIAIFKSI